MTTARQSNPPTGGESIRALAIAYGDACVAQAITGSRADLERAQEALALVVAAWNSGVTTTDPGLDERLRVAYNPDCDYGPNPGPTAPAVERGLLGHCLECGYLPGSGHSPLCSQRAVGAEDEPESVAR